MAIEREGDTTYAQVPVPANSVHWHFVEHMPEAVVNIDSFITARLQFPADAKAAHIQGRVVVTFVIDETGMVQQVQLHKHLYPSLDSEALRIIRLLPGWKPGCESGKNIPVTFSWPVDFKL
ncbi:MAG: hypothetical protein BGO69_19065 [Bacteroidetes bacterium 46-16]|nr:MAG: hypothetical protein BGO69_19065 [Bacteroidetes bacterium 46-16]